MASPPPNFASTCASRFKCQAHKSSRLHRDAGIILRTMLPPIRQSQIGQQRPPLRIEFPHRSAISRPLHRNSRARFESPKLAQNRPMMSQRNHLPRRVLNPRHQPTRIPRPPQPLPQRIQPKTTFANAHAAFACATSAPPCSARLLNRLQKTAAHRGHPLFTIPADSLLRDSHAPPPRARPPSSAPPPGPASAR